MGWNPGGGGFQNSIKGTFWGYENSFDSKHFRKLIVLETYNRPN